MKEQNFQNHARFVIGYHVITGLAIFSLLIGSFFNLFNSSRDNLYSASLICLVAAILVLIFWYMRVFALRAQDRAIRAEENFRYYLLTGKAFSSELSIGQIIALRFAPDEELPELVTRAINEKMKSKEIKAAIKNWRADRHRA